MADETKTSVPERITVLARVSPERWNSTAGT